MVSFLGNKIHDVSLVWLICGVNRTLLPLRFIGKREIIVYGMIDVCIAAGADVPRFHAPQPLRPKRGRICYAL